MQNNVRQLYLDIVRKTILGLTYRDPSFNPGNGTQTIFNQSARELGEDWPVLAHSMVGEKRLINIQELADVIIANNIPGDFIETGVWRGGACIFMAAILKASNISDRDVYVCDSFEGLPPPNINEYPQDRGDTHYQAPFLAVDLNQVKTNFSGYDLLGDNIKFVKGFFSKTLPLLSTEIEKLSMLRLDGDMYESTIVALENLYPKLSVGGYVIVDDYGLPNCRKALSDYRIYHGIDDEEYIPIDNSSVYWKKTKELNTEKALTKTPVSATLAPPAPLPSTEQWGSINGVSI